MSVRVKICGISRPASLQAAIGCGADMVGFLYYPDSPRHVEPEAAGKLRAALPKEMQAVSVGVDMDDRLLEEIHARVRPDFFQLHGMETPRRAEQIRRRFGVPVIKVIRVRGAEDIAGAAEYENSADLLLFDTGGGAAPGGTGTTFDWDLLQPYRDRGGWILSGGLTAENVADAIRQTGAAMVDVSSGVESAPGQKDANRIERFLGAAKSKSMEMAT